MSLENPLPPKNGLKVSLDIYSSCSSRKPCIREKKTIEQATLLFFWVFWDIEKYIRCLYLEVAN